MEETWSRAWRLEVRSWAALGNTGERGPRVRCQVGVPAGERAVLPDEATLGELATADASGAGLRADLVDRALDGLVDLRPVRVWVARLGPLGLGDVESAWHAAARHALARHGLGADRFLVLNRTGWLHVATGERREWSRPRPRDLGTRPVRPWDAAD